MSNLKIFRIELSGWGETMYYTITALAGTTRDAVIDALQADKPITEYRPQNWTPQMSYRCSLHGWSYGCGIDGQPDIRL